MWLEKIPTWAPGWAFRKDRAHWLALFATMGAVVDGMLEVVYEAALASMPGQTDDPKSLNVFSAIDALELLGRDRRILRGLAEGVPSYAAALRRYRQAWAASATVPELLGQLARVLGPTAPRLRIVNSWGTWWTREPDGTLIQNTTDGTGIRINPDGSTAPDATHAHAWNWDAWTDPPPPDQNDPGRFWLIVYVPASGPYLTDTDHTFDDLGTVGDGWNDLDSGGYEGSPDAGTVGTNAPHQLVELVRALLQDWRAAGLTCAWVVVAFDPSSFAPDGSSAVYPDGHWGYHTKYQALGNTQVPSRLASAEYWPGNPGGMAD